MGQMTGNLRIYAREDRSIIDTQHLDVT